MRYKIPPRTTNHELVRSLKCMLFLQLLELISHPCVRRQPEYPFPVNPHLIPASRAGRRTGDLGATQNNGTKHVRTIESRIELSVLLRCKLCTLITRALTHLAKRKTPRHHHHHQGLCISIPMKYDLPSVLERKIGSWQDRDREHSAKGEANDPRVNN